MPQTVTMIGLRSDEVRWVQLLVTLLRDPDGTVNELTRQALLYIAGPPSLQDPQARNSARANGQSSAG